MPTSGSVTDHHQQALDALRSDPPDYNGYSANIPASYYSVYGRMVLLAVVESPPTAVSDSIREVVLARQRTRLR